MGLISSEDQYVGTCILFKSSSELMEELEALKKIEQKKLNKQRGYERILDKESFKYNYNIIIVIYDNK